MGNLNNVRLLPSSSRAETELSNCEEYKIHKAMRTVSDVLGHILIRPSANRILEEKEK